MEGLVQRLEDMTRRVEQLEAANAELQRKVKDMETREAERAERGRRKAAEKLDRALYPHAYDMSLLYTMPSE